jgi:3-deoxy-manno-octulosonate cytidylyltransferase (CMP-KDO synthetase)
VVKIALAGSRALYFSRAAIPHGADVHYHHIGIYAYRVALLHRFVNWSQAELEKIESLEQLRVLAQGEAIHVAPACMQVPGGVDTEADLMRVKAILETVSD